MKLITCKTCPEIACTESNERVEGLYIVNSSTGFTLIEAIIGIAASSLVGILLISALVQNNGLFSQQTANINQGLNLTTAAGQISEVVKYSSSVEVSYPSASPQYISNSNTLVLSLPSLDSSGNNLEDIYDYAVITKDSQNVSILRKMIFPNAQSTRKSSNQVLTTRLAAINFYYYDIDGKIVSPSSAAKVGFALSQKEKAGSGNIQSSTSAQINLKNK